MTIEQRVVDADAEADHQADERREVGDLHEVAGEDDERAAEADAEQRDADRQAHGQHRAERDDQDDDGEGEAEQLGRRLLELGEEEAAELDAQPVDLGDAARGSRRRCRPARVKSMSSGRLTVA